MGGIGGNYTGTVGHHRASHGGLSTRFLGFQWTFHIISQEEGTLPVQTQASADGEHTIPATGAAKPWVPRGPQNGHREEQATDA